MQVPADQVIAIITTELGDMHRENAILKVQVSMLTEQLSQASNNVPQGAHSDNSMQSLSSLPPFPETTPAPDLATS
jgi:hypothetical protein